MSQIISLISNFDPLQTLILIGIFLFAAIVKGFLGIGLPAASMAFLTLVIPEARRSMPGQIEAR